MYERAHRFSWHGHRSLAPTAALSKSLMHLFSRRDLHRTLLNCISCSRPHTACNCTPVCLAGTRHAAKHITSCKPHKLPALACLQTRHCTYTYLVLLITLGGCVAAQLCIWLIETRSESLQDRCWAADNNSAMGTHFIFILQLHALLVRLCKCINGIHESGSRF